MCVFSGWPEGPLPPFCCRECSWLWPYCTVCLTLNESLSGGLLSSDDSTDLSEDTPGDLHQVVLALLASRRAPASDFSTSLMAPLLHLLIKSHLESERRLLRVLICIPQLIRQSVFLVFAGSLRIFFPDPLLIPHLDLCL